MTLQIRQAGDLDALAPLYKSGWDAPADVREGVAQILAAVSDRGDEAVLEYTRAFDDPAFAIDALAVPIPDAARSAAELPEEIVRALTIAHGRVRDFHARQIPPDLAYRDTDGTSYAFVSRPLGAIAAYVPGGTAVLPSSVIMNTVPAKVAGVDRVIVLSPPRREGGVSPAILFACALCGVDELYAVGGAQAIGAAAFGTRSIAPVDKIVGPGNVWVTEAKRQVFGICGIDGLAGPSEVLVVADDCADPELVVCELLAQAEHDALARVAVVSESRELLESCVAALMQARAAGGGRAGILAQVLRVGAFVIHAGSSEQVFEVIERFAPEHLALHVRNPQAYVARVRRAGAVFCGAQTPVAWGDYIAGTNHVLPTSGAARFSSGLRTADFLRTFSVLENSPERTAGDIEHVAALAAFEGLPQHARSALLRS